MPTPARFPKDLQPSTARRFSLRALRTLNTPPFRILLTLLVLFVVFFLLLGM